ncbi:YdcH family protein [Psychromarinibacter sp. C21-152]|uniref:YdcH family protein n=1 Tax=Psychromarinibacter sediminicola TaxID=3033385 RepID=A0AAE3T8D2_9RHOB|nr:YdcH family protein [Psychromarinibacter sediminicola]MDF0600578.1 YdcH family protein [Psychromarinibacter sediminicola]
MSHVPHDLAKEFPEYAERIHVLKQEDKHFAKLAKDYDEINHAVHLAETNVDPVEELAEVEMRKKRMALKDELYRILSTTTAEG